MKEIMFGNKKTEAARKDGANTKNKRAGRKAAVAFVTVLATLPYGCGLAENLQNLTGGEQDKTEQPVYYEYAS